jgi:hypothetical protein
MHPKTAFSAAIARSITREASKQTYLTIRGLVPSANQADACRAYAYFRWLDDMLDGDELAGEERAQLIVDQRLLLDRCLSGHLPRDLQGEEWMLADLTSGRMAGSPGLHIYLQDMMEVMDFDARRRHRRISQCELVWYSRTLARAVSEAVYTFMGEEASLAPDGGRYLAADGAHIVHMLRDMYSDIEAGYYNIPLEILPGKRLTLADLRTDRVRQWIRTRVDLADAYFTAGRQYLDGVDNLRCRLAGAWYAARFRGVVDAIRHEQYRLRSDYRDCKGTRAAPHMVSAAIGALRPSAGLAQRASLPSPAVAQAHLEPSEAIHYIQEI